MDPSGTVYVRTADSEREIGTWQAGDPDGAVAFFGQRFDGIVAEVDLLEQRLRSGKLNPDEARSILRKHRSDWLTAHAMGDFVGLEARLAGLDGLVDAQRAERSETRARVQSAAKEVKERLVTEAESLGRSNDWRSGVTRFRQLLDQWKAQPRLDRHTDDDLWHRFSAARTAYTRRRKAHFAEASAKRDGAREVKERLVVQAEELATLDRVGTDRGEAPCAHGRVASRGRCAEGHRRRAVGAVPRGVRRLLRRAYCALLGPGLGVRREPRREGGAPGRGRSTRPRPRAGPARATMRSVNERWNEIGKVPRDSMKSIEARLRAVEKAIDDAEQQRWQRTDPELRARAESTVTMLRDSVDKLIGQLDAANAKGDSTAAASAQEALTTRQSWLAEAERALADFSG